MIINEEEKGRRWKEIIERSEWRIDNVKVEKSKVKRDWKKKSFVKSNLKDLWLLGIVMWFWVLFGLFMEFV